MSGSNKRRHYSDKKASNKDSIVAKVPIVLLSMILSGLILLTVSAYLALKTDSPIKLSAPLSAISLYLSSFIGGAVCSWLLNMPDSCICAILSSSTFTFLLIIMKALIPSSSTAPQIGVSVVMHGLIVAVSIIGVLTTEKIKSRNIRKYKSRRQK